MMIAPTIGIECDGVWTTVVFGSSATGGFGLTLPRCDTPDDTIAVIVGASRDEVTASALAAGWWIESDDRPDQRAQCAACRAAGPAPESRKAARA